MIDSAKTLVAQVLAKTNRPLSDIEKLPGWARSLIGDLAETAARAESARVSMRKDLQALQEQKGPDPWTPIRDRLHPRLVTSVATAPVEYAGGTYDHVPIYGDTVEFRLVGADSSGKRHYRRAAVRLNAHSGYVEVDPGSFVRMTVENPHRIGFIIEVRKGDRPQGRDTREVELVELGVDPDYVTEIAVARYKAETEKK